MNYLLTLLLCLTALSSFSQKKQLRPSGSDPTYAHDWKRADSLAQKGLPKSALEVVNKIYARAKADRNDPQLVKSAMYRLAYQPYTTEDTYAEQIDLLRHDVAETPVPARNILQSILAETYWQYYEQNRWKFGSRKTDDTGAADPRTWDLRRLTTETVAAYEASLAPVDLLQKTAVEAYEVIIQKGDADARLLRPTLYDFLAHRALAFFEDTEPDITRPANRFMLSEPTYLMDAARFAKRKLVSSDSLSLKFRALQLYQHLIAFHQTHQPANKPALADVDTRRLAFVHQYSTLPDKDALYQQALEKGIQTYQNQPASVFYGLALATHWANLGDKTKTGGWRRKAADLATDLLQRFPKAGLETANAQRLLDRLNERSVGLTVEEGNLPSQPIRALVSYRHVPRLYYRIVRVRVDEPIRADQSDPKKLAQRYLRLPVVQEGSIGLPNDGDLQEHTTEIPLPALPLGHYVVLAADQPAMTNAVELLSHTPLTVTSLSYLIGPRPVAVKATSDKTDEVVDNKAGSRDTKLYVLNRESGQPMADVQIDVLETNYTSSRQVNRKAGTFRTGSDGGFMLPNKAVGSNSSYLFRIIARRDTLETKPMYQPGYWDSVRAEEEETTQVLLFTDRAIYRPGQTIFFKGVLYKGHKNDFRVIPNAKTNATLTDANGEEVTSLTLTSNAFGTVDGQFTAPTGRLTGTMTITIEKKQVGIRVEEYKRPTFEVVAEPVKGSYKLGQVVSVSAVAKTFAGAVVDGASVRYRVVRRQQPRWFWWEWGGYTPSGRGRGGIRGPETEIATGILTTDATGRVSLTFTAAPDALIDQATDPTFNFSITFDVTDRTGETRSAEQRLTIGYSALTATLELPAQLDNRNQTVALRVTNASGERVAATGQLIISPLQQPDRPLRKRLWQQPDRFVLSRDEFKKLFPADAYTSEDQVPNWPKGQAIETIAVGSADTLTLALSRYPAGTYAAHLHITDATGESTTLTQYFTVATDQQPLPPGPPDGWVKALSTTAKPGQMATFLLNNGEMGEGGYALMRVVQNGEVRQERWVVLSAKPLRVEVPVTAASVGGFVVSFSRVRQGRLYDLSKPVTVPVPDKTLQIETLTFRDHLKPGQVEQWTLRISGPGQEKLLAETVATLYDASLDAFAPLNWPSLAWLYPTPYQSVPGWSALDFSTAQSSQFVYQQHDFWPVARNYAGLNWPFGYIGATGGRVVRVRYGSRKGELLSDNAVMAASAPSDGFGAARLSLAASPKEEEVFALDKPAGDDKPPTVPLASPRRNLSETAFFFPKLQTDEQGRVLLNFTMPEALTRWRLLAFAHTPDLKVGSLDRTIITQKELMISANVPRFLREGDTLQLTARVNNLTDQPLTATAGLQLMDALTGQSMAPTMGQMPTQTITIAPRQSQVARWTLVVPPGLENVTMRVSAQAGTFTDAEEQTVPVLPNRMLVLDSQPFYVNGPGKKEVRLKALINQNPELPGRAERLTVELTSNPVWTALQSLPYLADFPYECAEQLFSRFYANALAGRIVNARPDIRAVAEGWAKQAPVTLLEANAELKSVTLSETPWRRDARDQTTQQARIGQFLLADNLLASQQTALEKLQQLQTGEGGFMWFSGMPVDRSISLHVLAGFGHLAKLGVMLPPRQQAMVTSLQNRLIQYADEQARVWVEQQTRQKTASYDSFWPVQYLYARSFYPQQPTSDKATRDYLVASITKNWLTQSIQGQALSALVLHRLGDHATAVAILASLKERAAQSDELGMYWPTNRAGYFWQQAPVETQALLIEAFSEIASDQSAVNAMKQWLLSQKRTQAWPSTKATTEAIYALLLTGSDWLNTNATAELRVGGQPVDIKAEGPVGYQKITYQPANIRPEMGVVTVSKSSSGPAWGSIYYQHFEPLDRVVPSSDTKAAMGNLTLTKQLFVQHDSPAGPVSQPVTDKTILHPGDRLLIRVEVRTDRDMQYVHLKDSRASGFELVDALSGYRYQNGLGYYEAPRDASTDFYLSSLPAGTHVFEYSLRVVHKGDFSAGVATIQCFYAPEFAARSAGGRVRVQ